MPEENAPPAETSTEATAPAENSPVPEIPSSGPAEVPVGEGFAPEVSPAPDYAPPISPQELTEIVGIPSSAPKGDISMKDMFLNADPVVQAVMLLLLLASVASWVIIFEKIFMLRNISRNIALFKRAVDWYTVILDTNFAV